MRVLMLSFVCFTYVFVLKENCFAGQRLLLSKVIKFNVVFTKVFRLLLETAAFEIKPEKVSEKLSRKQHHCYVRENVETI